MTDTPLLTLHSTVTQMQISQGFVGRSLVALVLVLALVRAHVGWSNDRKVFRQLRTNYDNALRRAAFLAAGDDLKDVPLSLKRSGRAASLVEVAYNRGVIVYFGRKGCPPCDWYAARMDSILPAWRDSMLLVSTTPPTSGDQQTWQLDSAQLRLIPALPTLLVVDENGRITRSAVGLKRMLNTLSMIDFPGPTPDQLLAERVDSLVQ